MKGLFSKLQRLPFALRLYATLSFGVLLAGLLLVIFHLYTQSSYLQSLSAQNQDFVAQVDTTGYYTESFLRNMSNQIFYSREVERLRSYAAPTATQRLEGIRELNSYAASGLIVDSIYLYNGQQDYIYSTESYGAVSDSTDAFLDQVAVELFLHRTADQRLELFPRASINTSRTDQVFSYMYYEVNSQGQPADNAIMFNLDADWITALFFSSYSGENAFLLNQDNEIVAQKAGADQDWTSQLADDVGRLRAEQPSGYFEKVLASGQQVVCFYAEMGQHNWCYVRPLDYDQCLGELGRLGEHTFLLVAIGFLSLVAVGVAAAMFIYVPYRRVTEQLVSLDPGGEDDIETIMSNLNRLIQENRDSENLRRSLDATVRGQVIRNLLERHYSRQELERETSLYPLKVSPRVPVALCLISGVRIRNYRSAIEEVVPACEGAEIQNEYTVFLLQTDRIDQVVPVLRQLHTRYPSLYFLLGPSVSDWTQLPTVYGQLTELYHLRFLHPKEHLLHWEVLPHLDPSSADLTEQRDKLLTSLRKGFCNKAVEEWEEFVALLEGKSYPVVRFSLINLDNGVRKLFDDHGAQEPALEVPFKDFAAMLQAITDVEALRVYFTERFRIITTLILQEHKESRGSLIQDIMDTCQAQYRDPRLSSQELASRFGLSSAYLSRIFRQSTGTSLMDYINTLRIEKAKELLRDPNVLVKDVAGQVGIENTQYFFNLFKQSVGMTPKQYQLKEARKERG